MQIDIEGMMLMIAAIVVQAANDIARNIPDGANYPAIDFLTDAGALARVDDIVQHSPRNAIGRGQQRYKANQRAGIRGAI